MILRPLLRPITSSPLHGMFGRETYPSGAILHFDATLDPYTEQTGGPHTFNYSIGNPQYQRQADGSSIDVGAKVAADFYNGERWVRSCGAVTNLVPNSECVGAVAGTPGTPPMTWNVFNSTNGIAREIVGVGGDYVDVRFYGTATALTYAYTIFATTSSNIAGVAGDAFTASCNVALIAGAFPSTINLEISEFSSANTYLANGTLSCKSGGSSFSITRTLTHASTAKVISQIQSIIALNEVVDFTIRISKPQLTKTAYPQPYVPTRGAAVTQPASNATATNGVWFALADGSPGDLALTGGAMTAGIKARLAFASTDLPNSSVLNLLTPDDVAGRFLTIQKSAGGVLTANLSDGTNSATVTLAAWARNVVLHFYPQVKAGATQMRVGYKTAAATSITWGTAATYAGTFGPDATLDRLMIGFNNAYPFGTSKFTVVPGEIADAEILGWWA